MIVKLILFFKLDLFFEKLANQFLLAKVKRINDLGIDLNYVNQGNGGLTITGDLSNFKIHRTSHLKSNTFIECSGGVYIGKYFHTGRGLTIFSTNHNYNSDKCIPYDEIEIKKSVIINDFVWCGSNVTIVPGVTIGEGVVIAAGTVVTSNVPECAIIGGNPHRIIKFRDIDTFNFLKNSNKFY